MDERDLSTWRVRIDRIEESREILNSNSKYFAFIIEIQRPDSENLSITDEEKAHRPVARSIDSSNRNSD